MAHLIAFAHSRVLSPFMMILSALGLLPIATSLAGGSGKASSKLMIVDNQLSSLNKAEKWFNSKPINAAALKGKVVLVEFGTYTCINWLRTLPYVRAWASKYKNQGLVVIGVQTPEFTFESNIENVQKAINEMKIDFPVAVDNNYNIWNAFNNQYWPALYLFDSKGKIIHHQFGEGGYDQTEKFIQQLLAVAGAKNTDPGPAMVEGKGVEAAADWSNLKSGENYLGNERTENFSSPGGKSAGKPNNFNLPSDLGLNHWGLVGNWTIGNPSIVLNKANGKIVYRFHARDLHLVMGPAIPGTRVRFRVLIDGRPPETAHGADIDDQGYGMLIDQRLYQLIRQSGNIIDRTFEIEFTDPGAEAFSFTFG